MIWYNDLNDGIILSTRIRLARNLDKTPFPKMLDAESKEKNIKTLSDSVLESNSTLSKDFPQEVSQAIFDGLKQQALKIQTALS